jgi:hypothetical protein
MIGQMRILRFANATRFFILVAPAVADALFILVAPAVADAPGVRGAAWLPPK